MFLALCIALCTALLYLTPPVCPQPGPGASCLCFEQIDAGELGNPRAVLHAGDRSGRLFIAEQQGLIWIIQDGTRLQEPFLNITGSANFSVNFGNGIQNFAFHPDFGTNGKVYVYYTVEKYGTYYTMTSEFTVSVEDSNRIDTATQRDVFEIICGYGLNRCHYGGLFLFGPDNYLYIGHGDGLCCGDQPNNGQNKSNYYAAIHRIDVDSRTGNLEYGIPADNPFLDDPLAVPELYAYGVRQPYTAFMDQGDRITGEGYGRIIFGDVGDTLWEEVNVLEYGVNYGWSAYEGLDCLKPEQCGNIGEHVWPVSYYNRTYGVCSITGSVYRGCMNPDLDAWFLFTDLRSKRFFGMYEIGGGWQTEEIAVCETCPDGLTNQYAIRTITMGMDEQGEQYIACAPDPDADPFGTNGTVYRIVDPNNNQPPCPL